MQDETGRAEGSVTVTENGVFSISKEELKVPLGDGVSILTGALHDVCFTQSTPLAHDLSTVLGAVRCADRSILRKHARGWGRRVFITLPVYELNVWRQGGVVHSLEDVLQYLTGDEWSVRFVKRRRKPVLTGQTSLQMKPGKALVFVPYSHGLDSYAQTELCAEGDSQVDVIPVHLCFAHKEKSVRGQRGFQRSRVAPVPVSASVYEPKNAEQSFRTRPFLYDSLAAYAAFLSKGGDVLIPENGQGSLGGSLVRLGSEAPLRSCHPGFTSRLSKFFGYLTGQDVKFLHPALFKTKGQVFTELHKIRPNSAEWLLAHSSCSYDSRHANREGKRVHCGVCGNCVLRRMAAHAAGIEDVTAYRVDSLTASSISEALVRDDDAPVPKTYNDVARNAVRSMQRLADQVMLDGRYRVAAEAESLAHALGVSRSEARDSLNLMLQQHTYEWRRFVEDCGRSSWVAEFARG